MSFSHWLFVIVLSFVGIIVVYDKLTQPYVEDSKFVMLIGKPGCGKSTMLTAIAYESFMQHRHVFSSEPISVLVSPASPRILRLFRSLLNKFRKRKKINEKDEKTRLESVVINPKNLWRYQFPSRSAILIDEIGVLFQNRRYKEFDERLVAHFKRYRHDGVRYYVASQSMDTDVVIRRIISEYWLLQKRFRIFVIAKRLVLTPRKFEGSPGTPSTIEDDMVEDPKLMKFVTKGIKILFIPRWARMFDSYELPEAQRKLRDIDYSSMPLPYPYPQKRLGRQSGLLARLRVGVHNKRSSDDRQVFHAEAQEVQEIPEKEEDLI